MTECPNCDHDVPTFENREECPNCGLRRDDLFAVAAGHPPASERDTGIRRDPLRPIRSRETNGGGES